MIEGVIEAYSNGLGAWSSFALIAASFTGSAISAALGLGGGVFFLAVVATFMPAAAVIPVHGVVQLGSNTGRAFLLRQHVRWPVVAPFAIGSLIGAALGGGVAVSLPANLLRIAVGVFVLWSILFKAPAIFGRRPEVTGLISAFLTMFIGATGPFVAVITKSLGLPRQGIVATHGALMVLQHAIKIIIFGLLGFNYAPWIWIIIAMLIAGFAGTWVGKKVLNWQSDAVFSKALNTVLIVLALRLIWTATLA